MKKIGGMAPATGKDDIRSQLHLADVENKSPQVIADLINTALLEPMQEYRPLESLPPPLNQTQRSSFLAFLMFPRRF